MVINKEGGSERLRRALAELGVSGTEPSHHRSHLLHAIELFALSRQDDALENAARSEIDTIKMSNVAEH